LGKPSWAAFIALVLTCKVLNEVYCNPVDSGERISLSELDELQININGDFLNWKVKRQADDCDTDDDGDCDEDDERGGGGSTGSDDDNDDDDDTDDDSNNKPDIVELANKPSRRNCPYCINK